MDSHPGMVRVALSGADGELERAWATPVGPGRFRLENSPFWAYRVSWLDVVEAEPDATGMLHMTRVVGKSGHRTVRITLERGPDESPESRAMLQRLNSMGCSWEGMNPLYLAVDLPPEVELQRVADFLSQSGCRWEYADPKYEDLFPDEPVRSGPDPDPVDIHDDPSTAAADSGWWSSYRQRQQRHWSELRARGKLAYVVRGGVLYWALPVFTVVLVASELMDLLLFADPLPSGRELGTRVLIGLPLWTVGGLLFGLWRWHHPESKP